MKYSYNPNIQRFDYNAYFDSGNGNPGSPGANAIKAQRLKDTSSLDTDLERLRGMYDGIINLSRGDFKNRSKVLEAQKKVNELLRGYGEVTGQQFGAIKEDGIFGEQTNKAMALLGRLGANSWYEQNKDAQNRTLTTTLPPLPTPTTNPYLTNNQYIQGISSFNRADSRKAAASLGGSSSNLLQALMNADINGSGSDYVTSLKRAMHNRGVNTSDSTAVGKWMMDMGISGNLGWRDRGRIRKYINENASTDSRLDMSRYLTQAPQQTTQASAATPQTTPQPALTPAQNASVPATTPTTTPVPTKQEGGQLTTEDQQMLEKFYANFLQANSLQPSESTWNMFLQALQEDQDRQVRSARVGAKLNYFNKLKGICPEGTEKVYFKAGGRICSVCQKKQVMKAEQGKAMPRKKAISPLVEQFRNRR